MPHGLSSLLFMLIGTEQNLAGTSVTLTKHFALVKNEGKATHLILPHVSPSPPGVKQTE